MNRSTTIRRLLRHTDLLAAVAVVIVVTMLVIPLPSMLLDLFITLNISAALAVVVATMYLEEGARLLGLPHAAAADHDVPPGHQRVGDAADPHQGRRRQRRARLRPVRRRRQRRLGLVIFLILVVIQFVVVTNGAGRVAEVAARFTLDAMPGKQMAIDADLNAGLITDEQARARRSEIAREADFYGAMDGASKFVKGDAMAAVLITAINLIGGIVVGVLQQHLGFSDAIHTYSLLTVGDGLAAQIPALLISVATGIIVTRSASEKRPRHRHRQPDPAPAEGADGGRRGDLHRSRWSRACRRSRSCSSAGSSPRSAGRCATACPTSWRAAGRSRRCRRRSRRSRPPRARRC